MGKARAGCASARASEIFHASRQGASFRPRAAPTTHASECTEKPTERRGRGARPYAFKPQNQTAISNQHVSPSSITPQRSARSSLSSPTTTSRHFMARTPDTISFDALATANPVLLDSKIKLRHYSAERLFSPDARATFVAPDLDPIPRHSE